MPPSTRRRYPMRKKRVYKRRTLHNALKPGAPTQGFKSKHFGNLVYVDYHKLDAPSGTVVNQVYKGNGMVDPNVTGIGHQPRGFDQLMLFYDHFVVTQSKITVQFCNTGTVDCSVGIALRDNSTPETLWTNYVEPGNMVQSILTCAGSSTAQRTLTLTCPVGKFLGRSNLLSDPDLKGSDTNDPAEKAYFHIWCGSADVIANPGVVDTIVSVEYKAVFIEPKTVGSS